MRIWILMMLGAALAFGQAEPVDTVRRCRTILDSAAHDKNPDGRKSAAEALGLLGIRDNAVQFLAAMLDDRDVMVRMAVINSLGDLRDRRTIPLLRKALQDPVAEVDFAAAKVLYQEHDPEGTKFLIDVVNGESKGSSNYFSKEKRNALRMLHTPTKLFIYISIQAAGMAPVPGLGFGLSSAQGILMDPETSTRAASLLLMGSSRDPALADAVGFSLQEKEWSVRAAAVQLVATHPFPQFREKLVPLLDDKKGAVRVRAAAAYLRLAPQGKRLPVKKRASPH